ncbi:MAG TPA: hypothetical protein VNH17_15090, partial [Streptosporangiaceae bacterium]|nr:hypothetical protein [Streptosporangiaceae bacterium]
MTTRRFTTITVEAEVELADIIEDLDDDTLADFDLHRDGSCASKVPVTDKPDESAARGAIASLHRQAHPSAGT